ncbi:uncharacterized protein DS421_14g455760 [Arachis hypogaea]|nr:uncharacterized protein DS421_14g455760 [Arachis hypogaea]
MVKFEHDWPLASALIERWRPESHTFHLPCMEMTIILQDVAYQLGLRIDGDPVSGSIGGREQHHQGRNIEELCEQILGAVPGPDDRQSQTKWTVKLTRFHNTICGELEQDATEERLLRWLPLLEDLETCGRLSWGSAVLAWVYRQMCQATEHGQCNLGGCVQYRPDNARGESRLRHYRRTLNGIGMLNVEWTPYADTQLIGLVPLAIAEAEASAAVVCPLICFAIVEWLDGRFGCGEWFPQLLGGWHELWDARWAHTELFDLGDQHLVAAGIVPEDLPIHHPLAPDLPIHHPPSGGIFRSTIVLLIVRLTAPLNGLSSTVSADDSQPPTSTRCTNNSNR